MSAPAMQDGGNRPIAPMEAHSIRRIVAGQAITDLASTVKELVDNALDAGAMGINIRLFNQGIDIVEVSDDGCGVPMASRPMMAMKNATSKIHSFEDIYQVDRPNTLGFRGEALFCLANISRRLVVSTRTRGEELATRMEFLPDGYMDPDATTECAKKVGTTVAVMNLFEALPVRRKDFIKRIKKQRAKLLKMMQGYAILCYGVRFNLVDMVEGSGHREQVLMATSAANKSIEQTVSSVLGSRFLSGLTRVSVDLTSLLAAESDGTIERVWKVEGLVSKSPVLTARGGSVARELQFFSINHRPVELPKISRVLGDAWRAFDGANTKRPACVLCFTLPNNTYDVNLSPDKREVLLSHEAAICDLIREAVTKLWADQSDGTFVANEVETLSQMHAPAKPQPTAVLPTETNNNITNTQSNSTPSPRRRARRRMAFVHSFDNARMQHEEVGIGEAVYTASTAVASNVRARGDTAPSVSNQIAARSREDENTGMAIEDEEVEPSRTTPPSERPDRRDPPSDREKIRWSQTQIQFNKASTNERNSQENEIESLKKTSPEDENMSEDASPVTPEDSSTHTPRSAVANESEQMETTEVAPKETPSLASDRLNNDDKDVFSLQNFAFVPLGENADPVPSSRSREIKKRALDHVAQSEERDTVRTTRKERNGDTRRQANGRAHVSVETSRSRSRQQRYNQSSSDETPSPRTSSESSREEEEESSEASSPVRPRKRQRSDAAVGAVTEEVEAVEEDMNQEGKDGESRPPVVWNAFHCTEQVVYEAQAARLQRHAQKKDLQEVRKLRGKLSKNGLTLSNSEIGESVGVSDDDQDQTAQKDTGMVSLTKEDFKTMTVIGQFNLGFILARCRNNHLWILDQHACDEKYNFERLCATTAIHEQKLISPMPLELSPSEESCIVENMDIFEKNGFRFSYDNEKPPRHRLSLTALPHSGARDGCKAVQFGKDDVIALCAMLGADGASYENGGAGNGTGADGSGIYGNNAVRRYAGISQTQKASSQGSDGGDGDDATTEDENAGKIIARLPKAIAMFANRACRNSIMIGTALSQKEMETIIRKLALVDHPWNCPHGRPTMRHVRDILPVLLDDEKQTETHAAGPSMAVTSKDADAVTSEEAKDEG